MQLLRTDLSRFLRFLETTGKSPHTIRNYKWDLNFFVGFFAADQSSEYITLDDITDFLKRWQRSGKSDATMNRMKSSIASFFRYLVEAGHIAKLPFVKLGHKRLVRSQPPPIPDDERRLLQATAHLRMDLWLLFLLYLEFGLRLSEALRLNVSDVEKQDVLRVIGKRNKVRLLPITSPIRRAINTWLKVREQRMSTLLSRNPSRRRRTTTVDREALFLTQRGWRLSPRGAEFILKECFKKAGLEHLYVHRLRHGFGKKMMDLGIDLRVVQEMMGHEDIRTTQIYSTVTRDDVKAALQKAAKDSPPLL